MYHILLNLDKLYFIFHICIFQYLSIDNFILQHAVLFVNGDQYYGAKAGINVWAPQVTDQYEFSLSQIWVISGSFGHDLNTIEAGWQASLSLCDAMHFLNDQPIELSLVILIKLPNNYTCIIWIYLVATTMVQNLVYSIVDNKDFHHLD